MPILENTGAAWGCVAAGLLIHAGRLAAGLKRRGALSARRVWTLLLPAGLGLLMAWAGFALLQMDNPYATFRWCYTTGLLGLLLGTFLAARRCGIKAGEILDETAAASCLCMALARLSQRWLGETGIGPLMETAGLLTMINDWEEPALATWALEAAVCLLAAGGTALWQRRRPRAQGGTCCVAIHLLLVPQVLVEHFRSGEYMRFMMMRLEQGLFGLAALGALIWLCARGRGPGESLLKSYAPAGGWLLLAGVIALAEFLLDGKIMECPAAVSWTMFGGAVAGMIALALYACRRMDRSTAGKGNP
ncbi:MAG: hypothetical protein IJ231_10240 [Clostridia bacterium]|nr:hypothetical protein [Clostridia bacterium]